MKKRIKRTQKWASAVLAVLMIFTACFATVGCTPQEQPSGGGSSATNPSNTPGTPEPNNPTQSAWPTEPAEPTQTATTPATNPATEPTTAQHHCDYQILENTPATCLVVGSQLYVCDCGSTYRITMPRVEHHYLETKRVDPAVGSAGYIRMSCIYCNDFYDVEIPALTSCEHSYIFLNHKPATEDKEGYVVLSCVLCGELLIAVDPVRQEDVE